MRSDRARDDCEERRILRDRRGDQHDVRRRELGGPIFVQRIAGIDDSAAKRGVEIRASAPHTDDAIDRAGLAQRQRARAADQADADDDQF